MVVNEIETIDEYVKHLQGVPDEVDALFRDLLIGVTGFFRDTEAFKALQELVIPKIFEEKPADGTIRVWVAGCSTGEEAYSIAILLHERNEIVKQGHSIQVFATDLDAQAISTARAGVYPASVAADMSQERLGRFFSAVSEGRAFRVNKSIRDMLVFSEQDMTKDPPFSKLDLLSCRNVLIYMGGELQRAIIPLFHYSLNAGGFLFLGPSESIGEFDRMFDALDTKSRIFRGARGSSSLSSRPRMWAKEQGSGCPPFTGSLASASVESRSPASPEKGRASRST